MHEKNYIFRNICALLFIQSIIFCNSSMGQNHVPNPGFEMRDSCADLLGQLKGFTKHWYSYTRGTPDYYDTCAYASSIVDAPNNNFGFQHAIGGGYAGFYTYDIGTTPVAGNEYIATPIQPLTVNKFYEVSVSVSLADKSLYGSDGIGVLFYDQYPDSIAAPIHVQRTPQVGYTRYGILDDSTKWKRLKGYLLADSAYHHVVIGQFKDTPNIKVKNLYNNTTSLRTYAYYYIDSIVVKEAPDLNVEFEDSLLCAGDTITVGCFVNPTRFSTSNTFEVELSDNSGSFASPITIGTKLSNKTDSIIAIIPPTVPQGKYRIRLKSSNPAIISSDNGIDIQIGTTKPIITSITTNSPVCSKDDTIRIISNSSSSNIEWYFWRPYQYPFISSSNVYSHNFNVTDTGLYIIAASNGGCMSKTDSVHIAVQYPVYTAVDVNVTPWYNVPIGTELTFLATKPAYEISPAYQWSKNGNIINGAVDSFYKVYYGVTFVNGDSLCVDMTSGLRCPYKRVIRNCFSYEKYSAVSEVQNESNSLSSIFPNPSQKGITVTGMANVIALKIYDCIGNLIYVEKIVECTKEKYINIENIENGNYIISLINSSGAVLNMIFTKN